MSNTITIELCAEDRARLDKLTAALEAHLPPVINFSAPTAKTTEGKQLADKLEKVTEAAETATEDAEPAEATTPLPWEPAETPAQPTEQPAPVKEAKPSVTKEQIQQKVIQLAAGFGGTKKAAVREIVNAYAAKVTDIPEDKWTEVWEKLTALESEG